MKKATGRPMAGPEPRQDVRLTLPASEVEELRRYGDGSASAGVSRLLAAQRVGAPGHLDDETAARRRVAQTPALAAHAATIWADWPNWQEHVRWVVSAPVTEIVDWAETVETE